MFYGHSSCSVQKSFVEFLTGDLCHTQRINTPTHTAGNILDLVFTNIPDYVHNIKVLDHCEACLSDHFGITLGINFIVGRKTRPKKKVYNYNRANWEDLNYDLKKVDWYSLIESTDPHIAWPIFKSILKTLCDQHIPKRNTRNEFQPPWYDSECDKILRKK